MNRKVVIGRVGMTVAKVCLGVLLGTAVGQAAPDQCFDGQSWDCGCVLQECDQRCGSSGITTFDCNPEDGGKECICAA